MNDKALFSLFRKIHIEEGMQDEVVIFERWRLMQPLKGMNNNTEQILVELIRQYVASMR